MVIKKKRAKSVKKAVKKRVPSLAKKPLKKKTKPLARKKIRKPKPASQEALIGKVTHYFPHVEAAVIKLTKDKINQGDNLHLKGHSTDFTQIADSLQIDRVPVQEAKKGQEIGLRVKSRVREHDLVYRVKS